MSEAEATAPQTPAAKRSHHRKKPQPLVAIEPPGDMGDDVVPEDPPERFLEVHLREPMGFRVTQGSENTKWLAAGKGWLLEPRIHPLLGPGILVTHERSGHARWVPITNVAGIDEWRPPSPQEALAAAPQVNPAVAQLPNVPPHNPYVAPQAVDPSAPPPGWTRVKRRDLGPTALAAYERDGFVMVGDQKAMVVD